MKKNEEIRKGEQETYNGFDIGDETQEKIESHLTVQYEQHVEVAKNNGKFINLVV